MFYSKGLCDPSDMNVLITNGVGDFSNSLLPPVNILQAQQI